MADVTIEIAGRAYALACRDGEEAHITALGRIIDGKARDAARAAGNMTENRQLLFAALLLADALNEAQQGGGARPAADAPSDAVVATVEQLAERMEKLAAALESGTVSA